MKISLKKQQISLPNYAISQKSLLRSHTQNGVLEEDLVLFCRGSQEISLFLVRFRLFSVRSDFFGLEQKKTKVRFFCFCFYFLKLFLFLCELPLCTRLLPLFALAPLCPRATVITFKEVGSHRKKSKSHQKKRNLLSPRQKMYQIFSETPFWV